MGGGGGGGGGVGDFDRQEGACKEHRRSQWRIWLVLDREGGPTGNMHGFLFRSGGLSSYS